MTAVLGRRWRVYCLWYVEASAAVAAIWALATDPTPRTVAIAAGYLLLCATALTVPANAIRLVLRSAAVGRGWRLAALQTVLAISAAATAAAIANEQGWTAIVCILLVGNALWALEMDLRDVEADGALE